MPTIVHLLDATAKATGSDYQTAKLIGKTRQQLSDMRHGRLTAQPEDHALIAAVAGLDPEEALIRATLEKHANTPKGERLLSVLGNALHRTGAGATLLLCVSAGWAMTQAAGSYLATMCRPSQRWRQSRHCQIQPS